MVRKAPATSGSLTAERPPFEIATKMDFRRSGQLDERRRRVLMDELAQPADNETDDSPPSQSGSSKGPVRAYAPAVLTERQPRITELLPVRPFWASVFILLAVTAVATVECIHIHVRTSPLAAADKLAALDAAQRGSLAAWLSSMLLAAGAAFATVTFCIRMHRVDDYRGHYRIWLWAAAALAWGSLDAATGIHDSLGLALARLSGQSLGSNSIHTACNISWLSIYGLLFGTLLIRLGLELRQSVPAFSALAISALLCFLGTLTTFGAIPLYGPLVDSVVHTSITMLAHVAILSAAALYARHVYLDATGRLKVSIDPEKKKPTKPKPRTKLKIVKDESAVTESKASKTAASKPAVAASAKSAVAASAKPTAKVAAPATPLKFNAGPAAKGAQAAKAGASISQANQSDAYDEDEDGDSENSGQRLSRAERRRLKKLGHRDEHRKAA